MIYEDNFAKFDTCTGEITSEIKLFNEKTLIEEK